MVPYLDLLRTGFSEPPCRHDAGALLPHLFTVTRLAAGLPAPGGLCIFCATFRRLAPPSRYEASCPAEPGLSSTRDEPRRDRSARLLLQYIPRRAEDSMYGGPALIGSKNGGLVSTRAEPAF